MNKEKKKKIILLIVTTVIIISLIIGFSFAALKKQVFGSNGKVIYKSGDLSISIDETGATDLSITKAIPTKDEDGQAQTAYKFTVNNTGSEYLCYELYLEDDTDAQANCNTETGTTCNLLDDSQIRYEFTKNGTSTVGTMPIDRLLDTEEFFGGESVSYELKVWLDYDADNSAMGKYFFGKVKVKATQCRKKFTKTILANNPVQKEKTNMFNYASNGKYWDTTTNAESTEANSEYITNGLYSREDEDGVSYYFRGEVNNIVQFGAYQNDYYVYKYNSKEFASLEACQKYNSSCSETNKVLKYTKGTPMYWKIVRINGDGTLRLLYSGTSADATGKEVTIGYSYYNINYDDPKYTGYTYDNGTDSTIKKAIDSWYQTSFSGSSYDSKVVNGRFCSDSSNYHNDSNFGNIFASYDRLASPSPPFLGTGSVNPTLVCPVTSESYGGSYRLKAGLLTGDEMVLGGEAGGGGVINENTYLYDGAGEIVYWSMTPAGFRNDFASVWSAFAYSYYNDVDRNFISARPVINLNAGIIIKAGSGTVDDPYIIE